jgi:hypothetical protein
LRFLLSGALALLSLASAQETAEHGRLGIGLTNATWNMEHPFIDEMKGFVQWRGGYMAEHPYSPGNYDVIFVEDPESQAFIDQHLDAGGYPTELPDLYSLPEGIDAIHTNGFIAHQVYPDPTFEGRYKLIWEGTADVTVQNRFAAGVITDVVEGDHYIEFDLNMAVDGTYGVFIDVKNVDPTDHLRDMHLYRVEWEHLFEAGQIMSPLWLEKFGSVGTMRFMDLTKVNGPGSEGAPGESAGGGLLNTEAGRPTPASMTHYWKGISIEEVVDIANQTGINPWYTITPFATSEPWAGYPTVPVGPATDPEDLTRFLAEYVEANLDPGLVMYWELGNEMWNYNFAVWPWMQDEWLADPDWKVLGVQQGSVWEYEGVQAMRHMAVIGDVFAGQEERVVRVAATQTAWLAIADAFLDGPWWTPNLSPGGNTPPYTEFDATSIMGYFSLGVPNWSVTEAELADRIESGLYTDDENLDWFADFVYDQINGTGATAYIDSMSAWFQYANLRAEARDLSLVMYEGGSHTTLTGGGGNQDFAVLCQFYDMWNTSQQLVDVYAHAIELWESFEPPTAGRGGYMQFTSSNGKDCRHPFFMYYSLGDDNPKAQMLMAYNRGEWPPVIPPVGQPRPPAAFTVH